ncbi:hypothetical protein GFL88_32365 [Rhizobium leguminosarum bv. viciae]|nr:hypothetical protein [Rhizobium leguminosarum bv. viciae]NKK68099.1 hypothetical protein [Rhizobium leguminosarum bv. viciae]TBZ97521.1 hypothetical protein E0H57_31040 [Rhizobium leguminosarum bv. viciae]
MRAASRGFFAELVRAANEVEHFGTREVRNLLYRAITTVSDLREQVGIPGSGTKQDSIFDLTETSDHADNRFPSEITSSLLEAADLIRALWIVFDSDTRIVLTPSG